MTTFVFPEVHMARTICRFLLLDDKTADIASCPFSTVFKTLSSVTFCDGLFPFGCSDF